ncbi:MAG TPA: hypothetical protein PKB11_12250 [Desulfovibrio sp.]|uniref:hypothetical protein n=1 Tax=Desulfovibrio sp. TaxID=885 RepID=UPI002C57C37B|nr:hypothetical protein [Desulfovibrio sp.]HMM39520.1 hypothetical protein [Desulfovibrio sp.]
MIHHLDFLAGLERELADAIFASNQMTPAGFRRAIKKILRPDILDAWENQLPTARYRSWKGLEEAARSLHSRASRIFHGNAKAIQAAEDAANAIYGLIPLITGPRKRLKSPHDQEWDSLAFCNLCWRLAPAGKATGRRPALCARHQPRTSGYQQARRLKYDLAAIPSGLPRSQKNVRHFTVRQEYKDTFARILTQIRGANSFNELIIRLPCLQARYAAHLRDAETLLCALFLDIPDPYGKIAMAIPNMARELDKITDILWHAEAWLSLQANHPHGGSRKRNGDSLETEAVK